MPGNTSFYYAIFKKFQVSCATLGYGYGHVDDDASDDLAGGFSLRHPNHKYGIFGSLAPIASTFGLPIQGGLQPLDPMSNVPDENPLYVMLKRGLGAKPIPQLTDPIKGQQWPVMPLPGLNGVDDWEDWMEFNTGGLKLIDKFGEWIAAGKLNDTPKSAKLSWVTLAASPPKLFPGLTSQNKPGFEVTPLLFVASMAGDDGRRHGDHGTPDVPVDHVPDHFWNTSQIFLTDEQGFTKNPAHLKSGEEYYVAALIGNCGNWGAGRAQPGQPKIFVHGDAMAFNTFMSPNTALPSLGNLDPAAIAAGYEQYSLRAETWDVAGFRFNVDSVFDKLETALANSGMDLGGATPKEWLLDSHPCVKVRITAGELPNIYKPEGGAQLSVNSDPRKDRHIAQRNLAPFEITLQGAKQIKWKTFVVAQAGKGVNKLILEHGLPVDAFGLYLSVTKGAWDRYVAKGGKVAGFEVVREGKGETSLAKPFPDAVLLRQTKNDKEGATRLEVAAHDKEPFLGMALGIEWDPSRGKPSRLGNVSMIHQVGRSVAGGFTLQLVPARRTRPERR